MKNSITIVLLLLCLTFGSTNTVEAVWDLSTDSAAIQPTTNPTFGAWEYGYGPNQGNIDPTGYAPMAYSFNVGITELFASQDAGAPLSLIGYHDDPAPLVGVNPGETLMAQGSNLKPAKVRWTAPSAMTIDISGKFTLGNAADVLVSVIHNDDFVGAGNLFTVVNAQAGGVDSPFDITGLPVLAGDTIDFVLHQSSDFNNSHTGLVAVITPEPVTMVLMGLGSLMVARQRWRRSTHR